MAVYVDELRMWGIKGAPALFMDRESCHMYADTVHELHWMARQIGLRRQWFQDQGRLPHYDLTATRRAQAIKLGAVEHDGSDTKAFMRLLRRRGGPGYRRQDG